MHWAGRVKKISTKIVCSNNVAYAFHSESHSIDAMPECQVTPCSKQT